jgi:hypothetical protein
LSEYIEFLVELNALNRNLPCKWVSDAYKDKILN